MTDSQHDTGPQHAAFFYRDVDEFTEGVVRFAADARAEERLLMMALSPEAIDRVSGRLGERRSAQVRFVDMHRLGRNPTRIIPAVQSFLDGSRGRPVAVVGEPMWPSRSPAEAAEVIRHEALINTAFEGRDARLLCPYDAAVLDDAVLVDAAMTHPAVLRDGDAVPSQAFSDPHLVWRSVGRLAPVPEHAAVASFDIDSLGVLRDFAGQHGLLAGFPPERMDDLLLVADELATNSIRHGGGSGTLALWADESGVVVEVQDEGRLRDPMAGRRVPGDDAQGGWGLWMVNQLCDLVQLHPEPGGTRVRVHLARAPREDWSEGGSRRRS